MIERKQYFGYRCKLADHGYDEYWCGVVCVPKWHPVRSVGLDDLLVLRFEGEWNVFIDGDYIHIGIVTAVHVVASRLYQESEELGYKQKAQKKIWDECDHEWGQSKTYRLYLTEVCTKCGYHIGDVHLPVARLMRCPKCAALYHVEGDQR